MRTSEIDLEMTAIARGLAMSGTHRDLARKQQFLAVVEGLEGVRYVALADSSRNERRCARAEPDRDRIEQREHGLGQPDGRHRIGAELRDEEYVNDDERCPIRRHLGRCRRRRRRGRALLRLLGCALCGALLLLLLLRE